MESSFDPSKDLLFIPRSRSYPFAVVGVFLAVIALIVREEVGEFIVLVVVFGVFRNQIVLKVAGHGFSAAFLLQEVLQALIWGGVALAVWALYFLPVPYFVFGLLPFLVGMMYIGPGTTAYAVTPSSLLSKVRGSLFITVWNEGRLCLLQFLTEISSGIPDYVWLRRGLRRVEEKLPSFGVTVPRGSLFFGCGHKLMEGIEIGSDLRMLADWLWLYSHLERVTHIDPAALRMLSHLEGLTEIRPVISDLLSHSRKGSLEGLVTTPSFAERFSKIPLQQVYYLVTIVSIIIGAVLVLLREFH